MGSLRTIIAGLFAIVAIIGGIVLAAIVAAASIAVIVARRLFRRCTAPLSVPPSRHRAGPATTVDVIDVVATEVKEPR